MDLGLTPTTLKKARARLGTQFSPGDATGVEFRNRVNEIIERFHQEEMWVGSHATFSVDVTTEKSFYLPYYLEAILHARVDKCPGRVQSSRFEFISNGYGEITAEDHLAGTLIDLGVSALSVPFPTTASTLRVTGTSASDNGKDIRILGYDASGNRILSADGTPGEVVTLDGDLSVVTSNTFSAVQAIQKENFETETFAGRVSVAHVTNTITLATLEPFVENSMFRGYRVVDTSAERITTFCKRRPVAVIHDEDYLYPGNLNALRFALMARDFEDNGKLQDGLAYFEMAIRELNNEASRHRGGAEEHLGIDIWGIGVSGISNPH
jgi:hypothetical protein